MSTLIISQEEVKRLLPMKACIEVMQEAFLSLSRGAVAQPLRMVMGLSGGKVLGLMPALIEDDAAFGAKVISVFPGNHQSPYDSHQGVVLLYEAGHGCLQAIVDATAITAIRTAAVSAVATRALANPGAKTLALLGAGVQARAHLEAMREVFELRQVRVWCRSPEESERFALEESKRTGLEVGSAASAEKAVDGADLICTTTASREPILSGKWIMRGAHVNAIGASIASARELNTEAVRRSKLFVDRLESAQAEAGDYLIPLREGAIDASHLKAELCDVLSGKLKGRENRDEITLFKSVGLAVQDIAAARYVYRMAREGGLGVEVELGGRRL
jgi:ornithine cyclodeaminase